MVFALWLVVFALKIYSQAIPQLDTLTLYNGLKIYLLQYGEDSVLNVRLVINGGKKNETACQVGYSEVIRQLLDGTLKEKQGILKKKSRVSCEMRAGQTILSGNCSNSDLSKEMELLSTTVARLSFKHDKIHRIVASIIESYTPEKISAYRLAGVYKDLVVYGPKHPLGRNYCQYQVQKMLPGELREFYIKHYSPKSASLLICGNFNVHAVKRIVTKQFDKWKLTHKEESVKEDDLKLPKIKSREIAFVNKQDSKHCLLKWVQAAPSFKSPDHTAFLMTCELFDRYLAGKIRGNHDTLNFKPVTYTTGFMEINCITGQNEMTEAIKMFDTVLRAFNKLKFTGTDLEETVKSLKDKYIKNNTPETILSFYDPLLYDFGLRKNYPGHLSGVTIGDLQMILKNYFRPGSYKLIIVGKEHVASGQLNVLEHGTRYQASDFETCDEACVVHSKKKWKKGRGSCCFKCFMRGWCPCMYSPARLQ